MYELKQFTILATLIMQIIGYWRDGNNVNLQNINFINTYMGTTMLSSNLQDAGINDKLVQSPVHNSSNAEVIIQNNIPLSFSQERLSFLDQLEGSLLYHLPIVFKFTGSVNKDAVIYCLNQIVNRHIVLRSVIIEKNDESFQSLLPPDELTLGYAHSSASGDHFTWADEEIASLISVPFDLSKDRKLRATLLTGREVSSVLVIVIHHIAADRISLHLFKKEFYHLYTKYVNGNTLPETPFDFQYTDYAV